MSGSESGEVLPPPAPADAPEQNYTMTVFWEDLPVAIYRNVVSFEPGENAYLAITKDLKRIVIPYGKVLRIEVNPDEGTVR